MIEAPLMLTRLGRVVFSDAGTTIAVMLTAPKFIDILVAVFIADIKFLTLPTSSSKKLSTIRASMIRKEFIFKYQNGND